jgi:uncharacterized membrane protein YsdA (DUF1294 family)
MALPLVAAWYLVASVVTLVVYAIDKRAARRDLRRVPEAVLHALALLGGWPGALLAQRLFHHKTLKMSFQLVFWLTAALNCAGVAWMWRNTTR